MPKSDETKHTENWAVSKKATTRRREMKLDIWDETFVLNGLALARGRALGDGASDEEDELLGGRPLEVAEVADVGGVSEDHRIRRP